MNPELFLNSYLVIYQQIDATDNSSKCIVTEIGWRSDFKDKLVKKASLVLQTHYFFC